MKKVLLRLGEGVCIALLAAFIIFVCSQDKISTVPFSEVSKAVSSECNLKGLEKRDGLELRRKFSIDTSQLSDVVYYSSNSVMDVRELMVIFCEDNAVLEQTAKKIRDYVKQKEQTFEGYAPKEYEMISSHVLIQKKGYILFYIGQEKEAAVSAFSEKL